MRKASKQEIQNDKPAFLPRNLSETELQELWEKYHDWKNKNKGVYWYTARDDFLVKRNICNWDSRYGLAICREIQFYQEADKQWDQFINYEGKRMDAEKSI